MSVIFSGGRADRQHYLGRETMKPKCYIVKHIALVKTRQRYPALTYQTMTEHNH